MVRLQPSRQLLITLLNTGSTICANDYGSSCPATANSALMTPVRGLHAFAILNGARGRPKADVDALAEVLTHVSAMAIDLKGQMAEFDIFPLFVLPAVHSALAGDALITTIRRNALTDSRHSVCCLFLGVE